MLWTVFAYDRDYRWRFLSTQTEAENGLQACEAAAAKHEVPEGSPIVACLTSDLTRARIEVEHRPVLKAIPAPLG